MTSESRETLAVVLTAFPLLILSAYIVLWNGSNKDLRIIGASIILFVVGVIIAKHRLFIVAGAFAFTGLRWILGAIGTGQTKAIIAAVGFIGCAALFVAVGVKTDQTLE